MPDLATAFTSVVVSEGVAGEVWVGVDVAPHQWPIEVASGARWVVEDEVEGARGIVSLAAIAPHTPRPRPTLEVRQNKPYNP